MILPYAKRVNFDILMDKLSRELSFQDHFPLMNQIKKGDNYAYRILISTVLSSRTKDEVTAEASERLFGQASNPKKLTQLTEEEIADLIYPVGFFRVKAKNIKKIAEIVLNEYNGIVPDRLEYLLQLPGVGRKTANLVLGIAFNIDSITVDTHVHRISNRLGLINTKRPEETEHDLKILLPRKHWISFNTYLVAHGQIICKPISPICSQCKIINYCKKVGVNRRR